MTRKTSRSSAQSTSGAGRQAARLQPAVIKVQAQLPYDLRALKKSVSSSIEVGPSSSTSKDIRSWLTRPAEPSSRESRANDKTLDSDSSKVTASKPAASKSAGRTQPAVVDLRSSFKTRRADATRAFKKDVLAPPQPIPAPSPSMEAASNRSKKRSARAVDQQQQMATPSPPSVINSTASDVGPSTKRQKKEAGKPPHFTLIKKNEYLVPAPPVKKQSLMTCDCENDDCGASCFNRLLSVECDKDLCANGERCTNRRFQLNHYANINIFWTGTRGWGAQSVTFIPRGTFIIEYVGEVLDDAMLQSRLQDQRREGVHDYYFMKLSHALTIDARLRANNARFLNHSCAPNCHTQKWCVGGMTRVGIFAIHDIPPATELTYDYQFEYLATNRNVIKQSCNCGAPTCRRFVG